MECGGLPPPWSAKARFRFRTFGGITGWKPVSPCPRLTLGGRSHGFGRRAEAPPTFRFHRLLCRKAAVELPHSESAARRASKDSFLRTHYPLTAGSHPESGVFGPKQAVANSLERLTTPPGQTCTMAVQPRLRYAQTTHETLQAFCPSRRAGDQLRDFYRAAPRSGTGPG